MTKPSIDRDKLRAHAIGLPVTDLFVWLSRAIDLLPEASLLKLFEDYAYPAQFAVEPGLRPDLSETIRRFHAESMAGHYFDDTTRSCVGDMPRATASWIAECARLFDACLAVEQAGQRELARQGFTVLIDLLRELDRCETEIVVFLDEGGSAELGVPWRKVLPAWFRCLAPVTEASEYARLVVEAIHDFALHEAEAILTAANDIAGPGQRTALVKATGEKW
jgi:hypothetical protein